MTLIERFRIWRLEQHAQALRENAEHHHSVAVNAAAEAIELERQVTLARMQAQR